MKNLFNLLSLIKDIIVMSGNCSYNGCGKPRDKHQSYCRIHNNLMSQRAKTKWRRIIQRYKRIKGCSHCGFKNEFALQFDHIDPSSKNLGGHSSITNMGRIRAKEEMAKCRILCANCHAIHTHDPKGLQ